ncbi:aminotransferase class V-fold PLP-dependent enzyme [Micromonospora sp. NPDC007271]|uniref:aminotransferase class V-fold PLP-dependent enzyme n=1 Tax=Micromonospora sp. NPDC007271 TaxID=3154587 RepID=UPI0033E22970
MSRANPGEVSAGSAVPAWAEQVTPGTLDDPIRWQLVRDLFPLRSDLVHFDTATLGSVPVPALEEFGRADRDYAARPADPYERTALPEVRAALARNYGCAVDEIALVNGGTDAMSRILGGLDLEPGDEIVTTTHECYTVRSPLNLLASRRGVVLRAVTPRSGPGLDAEEIVATVEHAITPRTRVLQWAGVSLTTGVTFPTRLLAELAHAHGLITVVDGSLLAGQMPLNLHELGVDFVGGALSKYQCGPMGTGLLYARNRVLPDYNPTPLPPFWPVVSLAYPVEGQLPPRAQGAEPAYDLGLMLQQSDVADLSRSAALMHCVRMWERIGWENVQWYVFGLSAYLKQRIAEIWGRGALLTPADDDRLHSGIVAFEPFHGRHESAGPGRYLAFRDRLAADHGVTVQVTAVPVQGVPNPRFAIRLAPHLYNTRGEIDQALDAMVLLGEELASPAAE